MTTPASLQELIPILQVSIGPVILISGVGLLLLTMTNRLGRAIDRARLLTNEIKQHPGEKRVDLFTQAAIIYRRAKVLRLAISLSVLNVLLAGVLIISLFVSALLHFDDGTWICIVFILSITSLIGSLAAFLYDIQLSLGALKLELQQIKPDLQ